MAVGLALQMTAAFAGCLEVHTARQMLNPEDWSQTRVGQLVWCGGLALTSPRADFGGLSGLALSPDGARLTAIADNGRWFQAGLRYDGKGCLAGLEGGESGPLLDPAGKALEGKRQQDAEALEQDAAGNLLVSFERDHRVWRYPAGEGAFSQPAQPLPSAPGFASLPRNDGLEGLVTLADGRLLALTEAQDADRGYLAFLYDGVGWSALHYHSADGFAPTGAARLPSGDLLVVERRFTVLGGFAVRISRIAADDIEPGAAFSGREIAAFAPPLTYDNLEGIAALTGRDGGTRVVLISDDNFSPVQRTLLLMFKLEN